MISKEFRVSEKYELLALHRGLMEARFCPESNDRDVSGSPILANMHRRIVGALMSLEGEAGAARWVDWLQISPGRREWGVAVRRATDLSNWSDLNSDDKNKMVMNFLSPFDLSSELAAIFISDVDNLVGSP